MNVITIFEVAQSAMLAESETWKQLVGFTPNGQVTFLSDLWGGRVSDKQITRESAVLDLLSSKDNLMVTMALT